VSADELTALRPAENLVLTRGKVSRSRRLPTILTGLVVALTSGFAPIGVLGELVSIGTLFAFVIVSLGVWVLRRTHPNLERPFRTPWVPAVPIASAAVALLLMLSLPLATWARLFAWMAIGIVIYFVYGQRRASATHSFSPSARRPGRES
jgi:APA family basic amino acid/polyamine antiporter